VRKTETIHKLIELMVVISVIVILIAMLYPSSSPAIKRQTPPTVRAESPNWTGPASNTRRQQLLPWSKARRTYWNSRTDQAHPGSQLLANALFLDFANTTNYWTASRHANLTTVGPRPKQIGMELERRVRLAEIRVV